MQAALLGRIDDEIAAAEKQGAKIYQQLIEKDHLLALHIAKHYQQSGRGVILTKLHGWSACNLYLILVPMREMVFLPGCDQFILYRSIKLIPPADLVSSSQTKVHSPRG